jgi:hypothetical protein
MITESAYASIQRRIEDSLAVEFVRLDRVGSIDVPVAIAKLGISSSVDLPKLLSEEIILPNSDEIKTYGGELSQVHEKTDITQTFDELLNKTKETVKFRFPNGCDCNVFIVQETMSDEEQKALVSFGQSLYEEESESQTKLSTGMYL